MRVILVGLFLSFFTSLSFAQSCRVVQRVVNVVAAPVQQAVVVDQNFAIVGIPVSNLDVRTYYSVGDDLRAERIAEKVAENLKKEISELKDVVAQLREVQVQGRVSFDLLNPNARANQIFANSCLGCHKPGDVKVGMKLFSEDGTVNTGDFSHRERVYRAVVENRMPKGSKLSDEEKVVLLNWFLQKGGGK